MKNNRQKKHLIIITTTVLIATTLVYISGIYYYAEKRQAAIRAEMLKVESEMHDWQQQGSGVKHTIDPYTAGPDVIMLQRMLSQNEAIYPEKKITGYYGEITMKAVERFQETHNLPKTGIVDILTEDRINEVLSVRLCPEQTAVYPDFLLRKMTKQTPPLPANYIPPMLEEISGEVKTLNTVCLRASVVPNIKRMFQEAENDGIHLAVSSGYKGYKKQRYLYEYWHKKYGDKAKEFIAEPGKSEHHLGTAVDVTDASIEYAAIDKRFAKSDGGKWMQENAHKYGFIMSYPKEKKDITGYHHESWHWRFIGIKSAEALHEQEKMFNTTTHTQKKPFPINSGREGLTLSANAVLSVFVDTAGDEHILTQKNRKRRIPIASITKLMTALIASETIQSEIGIPIQQRALRGKGVSGKFIAGETLSLQDALHAILIESNNEVAVAIAETIGSESFIQKMNTRARELHMPDTHFVNVTGLDPSAKSEKMNYATASDIAKLLRYIFEDRKDIFTIMEKQEYTITTNNTGREVPVETTNELLNDQEIPLRVLGGKTGTTPKAKNNLTTISEAPSQKGYIITVILRSEDALTDTQHLLRYLKDVFAW